MAKLKVTQCEVQYSEIKPNPLNPRYIKDHKYKALVKSLTDFPEMLGYREIVVDENMVILGGNMRYKACKDAGVQTLKVTKVVGLSEDKKKEFIIKDNANYGVWDWDILANEYEGSDLSGWGLSIWTPTIDNIGGDDPVESGTDESSSADDEPKEKQEKKIIQIEFDVDDYEEAFALYQDLKRKRVNVAEIFTQKLKEELCK